MTIIKLTTYIDASIEKCFDLSMDLDLHKKSMYQTNERAIEGKTSGLIELNEEVTWRGKHLGFYHSHTAKITKFDRPNHFQDTMVKGRFKLFIHDHSFRKKDHQIIIDETLEFKSPFWPLSLIIETLILKPYLTQLLEKRNQVIKLEAEKK